MPRLIFLISSFPVRRHLAHFGFMLRIIFRVSVWYALPSFTSPGLLYFPPAGFAPAPPPPGAGFALAPPFRALFFPARVTATPRAARARGVSATLERAAARANAARRDAHRAPPSRASSSSSSSSPSPSPSRARSRARDDQCRHATRRVDARRRARGASRRARRARFDVAVARARARRGRARDARGRRGG